MNRRWIIALGAVLLIGAIAFLVWQQINNMNAARPQFTDADIAVARKGTLIATVSATGAIEPALSTTLAFLASGNVAEIMVRRGEAVIAGQPLARLETAALELQLAQAEANLAANQAALEKLRKGASAEALASARASLDSAKAAYEALKNPSESTLAAAKANLASARSQYNRLLHPDASELAIAKADLDKAQAVVTQAQAAFDRIGGASNPFGAQSPQALQLQTATLDYQKALAAFNAKFTPSDAQLKAAQAQIQQAMDALDRLTPSEENLARAEAQIKQAEDALARLTPMPEDVAQAQAQTDAARAGRDLAKQRVDEAILAAPIAGTVTTLELARGEFVQAGRPVLTLGDLNHLEIKLSIDETDIPRVQVGQPVTLDLDAFPGEVVEGTVREIAPAATAVQGVVNYEVRIDVTKNPLPIKAGMTANANVQVGRQENVLLIPTRAIRAQGSKRLVTILENGEPKQVEITLGLANDQETEILAGLDEGARVLTIALPSNQPSFGGNRQGN